MDRPVAVTSVTAPSGPARIVVLVSGEGTNLQALLDATTDAFAVVAVGSDRPAAGGLRRAHRVGIPTFVQELSAHPDRAAWDAALAAQVAAYEPDLVVLAGFMRLVSPDFLARFPRRVFNTHPALCPSFPGVHGPADALAYGVTVTGATLFVVDAGTDTGPIVAQTTVPVRLDDDPDTLHDRIKAAERAMLVDRIDALARHGWTVHESPNRRKVTLP